MIKRNKIATLVLSTCLMASFSGSAFASSLPNSEASLTNDLNALYSPGPGFPLADGVDELATTDEGMLSAAATASTKSYSTSSFFTGVYVGGSSKPTIFSLDSVGYAQFSSVAQGNVNPGESVQISYQTLDANSGDVLAGKNLSGNQSTAKVTLTTKVQKNTSVNAYLHNFTGNEASASGKFNW
ncbi:hypothetical protein B1B04_13830 [Lysinibacillus sp. KCTC 33748]|uniref:hypothetical protein n=1 Tax=unclassified Lysinibacillus TaxID=2636778 RepID=UPI0009A5C2D1|nr:MULTISPECIES: hypothetical protein [unclassified Lysinibacillus]OXS73038.1 hypothetical protein B1B04_13830 [Lysinibacillus sp. KCTC 33748]SKB86426.1 hypothetical protein SAMN06295926_11085 [Lysinibacillus sp. AC-3]